MMRGKKDIQKVLGVFFVFFLSLSIFSSIVPYDIESLPPPWLFSVHIIAPVTSAGMSRVNIVKENLPKIGINAEIDWISYAALGNRTVDQEVGMYSEGGYDLYFQWWSTSRAIRFPGNKLAWEFHSSSIPPDGFNIGYWSPDNDKDYNNYRSQESDTLISSIVTNHNFTEKKDQFIEWQKIWYDVMPNIVIHNDYEVHAISSDLFGYDPSDPLSSVEKLWFEDPLQKTVTFGTYDHPRDLNCVLLGDDYSLQYSIPQTDRLFGITPSSQVILPDGTNHDSWMQSQFGTPDNLVLFPRVAASFGNYSENGLVYNLTVRDDVFWHDGVRFDAWDAAFSFQARLNPILFDFDRYYQFRNQPFGFDNKIENFGNYSFRVEDKNMDGFSEFISFQLQELDVGFEFDILALPLVPEHILGDPINHGFNATGDFNISQWLVQPSDWRDHSTSTGRKSDPGGYAGPIGTGSMILKESNSDTRTVTFEKFEDIMWNGSEWIVNASNDYYNILNLTDMPMNAELTDYSSDAAIADMKAGDVSILDPQFYLYVILEEQWSEIQPILTLEDGWQTIYMNPKFEQDGIFHFNKKGVRHAISHIIPREEIIQTTLRGLGKPAYTPLPPSSWSAISESDMIDYKRSLNAFDGSKPLINTTTAYDNYSIPLALDWLETEGYNVTRFRNIDYPPDQEPKGQIVISYESFIVGSIFIAVIATYLYVGFRKKI